MSWSVNRIGKAEVIRSIVAADFERINCSEPEQTVKNKLGEAVDAILVTAPVKGYIVKIDGNGSQYQPDSAKYPGQFHNQCNLKVEMIAISE